VAEALRRLPGAVCAIWYPITERVRTTAFQQALVQFGVPALYAEIAIAGDGSQLRMKGCGLLVLNPPWRIEDEFRAVLPLLAERLRVDAGGGHDCAWLVPEK
jgi:23S rRNA (adenine2030-N6)-methyltransferase